MSQGPSMRDCMKIIESYNTVIKEEYSMEPEEVKAMFSKKDVLGFMVDYSLIGNDAVMSDEVFDTFADQYARHDVDDMDGEDWHEFLNNFAAEYMLNKPVEEEFTSEPFPGYINQIGREEREQYPALPLTIVAQDDVPTIFMLKGDTLELRPTNTAGEVYSEENGETYDWDYIAQLSNAGKLEIIVGDDGQPGEMVPYDDNMAIDEDPGDWDHGYNYEANENDFEPETNMCPDCEGSGNEYGAGGGGDCERCNGVGEIFEAGPQGGTFTVSGSPGEYDDDYEEEDEWAEHFSTEFAEKEKFKGRVIVVTDLYDGDVFGIFNKKRFMISSPLDRGWGTGRVSDSEIEVNSLDFDLSKKEEAFLRAWHSSIVNESGIREGWKDSLGRAAIGYINKKLIKNILTVLDNTSNAVEAAVAFEMSMDKKKQAYTLNAIKEYLEANPESPDFARLGKFYGMAGGEHFAVDVEESDKPYATMKDGPDKYLFRKDQKQKLVGSADNEPEDGEEELEETDMDKFIREMQIAAGIVVEEYKEATKDHCPEDPEGHTFNDNSGLCAICGWTDQKVVSEDCDQSEEAEKNDNGECSPFTHADENVDMVREDGLDEDYTDPTCSACNGRGLDCNVCDGYGYGLDGKDPAIDEDMLLAPPGDVGPDVDEEGRDAWAGHDTADYANSVGDEDDRIEPELDRQTDFDAPPRDDGDDSFGMREEGPGEFDYDPDAMVDVGDEEDYKEYDFDDEFETMLGGSSDMPEAELVGMYEMNDLRRLAGLEQIMEESNTCSECDGVGEVWGKPCEKCGGEEQLDEIAPVIAAVARGAGSALAKGAMGAMGGDDDVEEATAGAPVIGDMVAYEVDDETAYYVMADVIGNELDFGPEDEILVPQSRNDQVLAALDQQGFVKGQDFWVAGEQYEAELQNGYNDRKFSDGQDYFPKGATSQPAVDLGPTAGDQGDNPMSNKMRSVEKDDVYETMKLAYRRHRKS